MGKKRVKVASFFGGLVISSIVVGVLLAKNDMIRIEVEEQVTGLLKTTKSALANLQRIVSGLSKTVSMNNNAIETSNYNREPDGVKRAEYDALWDF